MSMKLSRFNAIYNGMNGTAKKVYEVVPKREHWSVHKIIRELDRKGGVVSANAVNGCLGYMLSAGIIEQGSEGDFIRTEIKIATKTPDTPAPTTPPTKEQIAMATTIPETKPTITLAANNKPTDPLDVLSALASRMRALAQRASDLEDEANTLADDFESTALSLAETTGKDIKELEKLRQLKALLGSLQGD